MSNTISQDQAAALIAEQYNGNLLYSRNSFWEYRKGYGYLFTIILLKLKFIVLKIKLG